MFNQQTMNAVANWLSQKENQEKLAQTWPARAAKSAWQGITLPGDVWHGNVDPQSEEAIQRATELAGTVTGGAFTKGATPNAVGIGPTKLPNQRSAVEDALIALHNTRADRLQKADELGGLAVPSLAIANPHHGFNNYGGISLVASPEFIKPSRTNPVFASDVYSPRFPNLNDEGTKIFKGFTDMGNRRYAPLTLENVVKEMKGNIRAGEGFNYGAGDIRATVTPQFKNLAEIQANRHKIVTEEQYTPFKEEANNRFFNLSEEFFPYYKFDKGKYNRHSQDFADMLKEIRTKGDRVFLEGYDNLPPELVVKAKDYLNWLKELPTEYFEAKPQRAVKLNEFKGAVIPHDELSTVAPLLEKHGIKRIEPYNANQGSGKIDASISARAKALLKFEDLFFSFGGAVENAMDTARKYYYG